MQKLPACCHHKLQMAHPSGHSALPFIHHQSGPVGVVFTFFHQDVQFLRQYDAQLQQALVWILFEQGHQVCVTPAASQHFTQVVQDTGFDISWVYPAIFPDLNGFGLWKILVVVIFVEIPLHLCRQIGYW